MAAELLKSWNAPSLVASVSLDAAEKKIVHQQGTQVSDLNVGDTISWTQLDAALPMRSMCAIRSWHWRSILRISRRR